MGFQRMRCQSGSDHRLEADATFDRLDDQIFPHIHRQGERLHDKMLTIAIDDEAGQSIALAPNHAAKFCIDLSTRPVFRRLSDATFKKVEIEILFPSGKTPRDNLRLRIVNRASNQMIFAIFERDHVAINWLAKD